MTYLVIFWHKKPWDKGGPGADLGGTPFCQSGTLRVTGWDCFASCSSCTFWPNLIFDPQNAPNWPVVKYARSRSGNGVIAIGKSIKKYYSYYLGHSLLQGRGGGEALSVTGTLDAWCSLDIWRVKIMKKWWFLTCHKNQQGHSWNIKSMSLSHHKWFEDHLTCSRDTFWPNTIFDPQMNPNVVQVPIVPLQIVQRRLDHCKERKK